MLLKTCGDCFARSSCKSAPFQKQPVSIQTFTDNQGRETDFSNLKLQQASKNARRSYRKLGRLRRPPTCWLRKLANIWMAPLQKKNRRTSPRSGLVRQPTRLSLTGVSPDQKRGLRFHGYGKAISGFQRFYFERLSPNPRCHGTGRPFNDRRVIFPQKL